MLSTPRSERFGVRSKSLLFLLLFLFLFFLQCSPSYADVVLTDKQWQGFKRLITDLYNIPSSLEETLNSLKDLSKIENENLLILQKSNKSLKQSIQNLNETARKDQNTIQSSKQTITGLENSLKDSNSLLGKLKISKRVLIITAISGTVLGLLIGTQLQ